MSELEEVRTIVNDSDSEMNNLPESEEILRPRTCGAAHSSSSSPSSKTSTPKLDDEEKMKQRAELLYPTMRENKTNNEDSENTNSKINNEIKHNEKFRNSMNVVFDNEGGFSDDKDDLGGRTNMGITQSTYDSYCNKRGIKTKDVKNITRAEAIEVYYQDYWKASGADNIDNPMGSLILFDTAVLHGVGRAKQFYKQADGNLDKILQLRKDYYVKRVKENPSQEKYINGWNNRVNKLHNILKKYEEKNEY